MFLSYGSHITAVEQCDQDVHGAFGAFAARMTALMSGDFTAETIRRFRVSLSTLNGEPSAEKVRKTRCRLAPGLPRSIWLIHRRLTPTFRGKRTLIES